MEKNLIDIKQRVYKASDKLYKDRINWAKKIKAPSSLIMSPDHLGSNNFR